MKRILSFVSMIIMALAWACTPAPLLDDNDDPQVPDAPGSGDETPVETVLSAPVLTADATSIVLDAKSDVKAVEFSWSDVSTDTMTPMYELILAEESDTELSSAQVYPVDGLEMSFTHKELADILDDMGLSADGGAVIDAFVFASASGKSVKSNVVRLDLLPQPFSFAEIYPVGAATPYGWDNKKPVAMTNNNGVFTCELHLTAHQDFKFLTSRAWWPGIVNASTDPLVFKPRLYKTQPADALDRKFQVSKSGTYRLSLDTTSPVLTLSAELLSEDEPVYETIYIAGDAVTENGYSLNASEAQFLTPVEGQENTYTWTGRIAAFMDFKFQTSQKDWIPSYNRDATSSEYWTLVYRTSYSQPDEKFSVDVTGTYRIVMNTGTLAISCELLEAETPAAGNGPVAVFMGDSITEMWNKEEYGHPSFFTDNDYVCKGISGQTTIKMFERFDADVIALSPKCVVICGGTNDIAGNEGAVTDESILENITLMASKADKAGIKVILCSILPCDYYYWKEEIEPAERIVRINSLISALAQQEGYTYVDYHSRLKNGNGGLPEEYTIDGCHPSKDAYTLMEGIIKPVIDSVLE